MPESIERIIEQVSRLTEAVQSQNKRLEKLEETYEIEQALTPQSFMQTHAPEVAQAVLQPAPIPKKEFASGPPTVPAKEKMAFSEENIGLYLSRIGMVGLLLGFGFLLKYSFDNDLIGPVGRVAIGYIAGLALFGVGEFYRKKYTAWSRAFTGGSLVLMYFSTFAAQFFFAFFSLPVTVLVLSIITILGLVISDWYDSPMVFSFAMIGGYLTPLIISGSTNEEAFLRLGYLVLLNVAIVFASHLKKWRLFDVLSFVITSLYLGTLYTQVSMEYAAAFIAVYFLTFAASAVSLSFAKSAERNTSVTHISKELLVVYLVAHAGFLYNFMYLAWGSVNDTAFGLFGILVSICYMGLAFGAKQATSLPKYLKYVLGSISVAMILASINTLATGDWQSILWSIITVGIIYAGYELKDRILRYIGAVVFFLSTVSIFTSLFESSTEGIGFLNVTFISLLIPIAVLIVASIIYRRSENLSEEEKVIASAMRTISNILLIGHVSLELHHTATDSHLFALLLASFYGVYGTVSLIIGLIRKSMFARYFGIIILATSIFPWFIAMGDMVVPTIGFLNNQFFLLLLPVLLLFVSAIAYKRTPNVPTEERSVIGPTYSVANVLLLSLITQELFLVVESDQTFAVAVSVFYALYAFTALAIGIILKRKYARFLGLILFAVTIFKVVLIDMQGLDLIYRVLAFISIGFVLILGSYLYQRSNINE